MIGLVPADSLSRFLEKASKTYNDALKGSPAAEYLSGRGIDPETADKYRLGYVGAPLPGHDAYAGCLAIPYLTPSGTVTSIRFRNLSGTGPKYLSVPGDPPRIYNTPALGRGTLGIAICEGELDTITADALCGIPAVGVPGANAWQPYWWRLLDQYEQAMLLADDDDAGKDLAARIGRDLPNLRVVVMSGGDVNDLYQSGGADAVRRKVFGK